MIADWASPGGYRAVTPNGCIIPQQVTYES
jgi:hypothetical protein